MKKNIFSLCLFLPTLFCYAQDGSTQKESFNPIIVASPIMAIAPDSRSSGMGDVGVASKPDGNSQHWNIAKYPFIELQNGSTAGIGVGLSYTPWLFNIVKDVSIAYLPIYYKINEMQSISTSLRYFSLGSMTLTNEEGQNIGTVQPNEFAIDIGYSRKLTLDLSMGILFRYIRSDLTGGYVPPETGYTAFKAGNGFAFDLALYGQKEINRFHSFAYGINFSNIGTKVKYSDAQQAGYFLPMTLKIGGRYTLKLDQNHSLSAMLDLSKLLVPTSPVRDVVTDEVIKGKDDLIDNVPLAIIQSFYDAPYGFVEEISEVMVSSGVEYEFRNIFAFRTGYFHDSKRKGNRRYLTFGASISYRFVTLDFSYLASLRGQVDPLANTLRASLMFNFSIPKASGATRR